MCATAARCRSQAPVGYDKNSYAYRDVGGSKFHESIGSEYGEPYGEGDVIGCHLLMGDPPASARQRQRITIKGTEFIVEEERERTPSKGSAISFYRNGEPQGVAFEDVWAEVSAPRAAAPAARAPCARLAARTLLRARAQVYFPAASLYKSASVKFNFGPDFACPPANLPDARPVCELATAASPADDADADGMFGADAASALEGAAGGEEDAMDADEAAAEAGLEAELAAEETAKAAAASAGSS